MPPTERASQMSSQMSTGTTESAPPDMVGSSDVEDEISSSEEGDLVDAEFLETSRHEKEKRRANANRQLRTRNRYTQVATRSNLPHPASSICRSITVFIKTMMGCNSASSRLPDAATSSELTAWNTWKERAQEELSKLIQSKIGEAATEAQQRFVEKQELTIIRRSRRVTNFTPAVHVFSSPLVSSRVKKDCDQEFEDRGFPRITFEWNSPTLAGSDWNSATASILLEHWTRWYQSQAHHSPCASIHSTAIVDRWLGTMKKRYRIERSENNDPGSSEETAATRRQNERKRKHRLRKAKVRQQTARMLFKKKPVFSSLFKDAALASDNEENADDLSFPPDRIVPAWRSDLLSEIIELLDEAAIQLAKSRKQKIALLHLLRHGASYYEENEQEDLMPVPSKLPEAAYSEEYLNTLSTLQKRKLKMKKDSSTGYVDLERICVSLRKLTFKPVLEEGQSEEQMGDGPDNAMGAGGMEVVDEEL